MSNTTYAMQTIPALGQAEIVKNTIPAVPNGVSTIIANAGTSPVKQTTGAITVSKPGELRK